MRNRVLSLSLVVLLALVAFGSFVTAAQAQSSSTVTCDSTLITLLYVAEQNYGFHSSMDLTKFDKGQLAPMFSAMMSSNNMMATEGAMMAATPGAMMATESAMMKGTESAMMSGNAMMTQLKPGVVQGENAACTSLRAEVEGFLMTKFSASMMH